MKCLRYNTGRRNSIYGGRTLSSIIIIGSETCLGIGMTIDCRRVYELETMTETKFLFCLGGASYLIQCF